MKLPKFENEAEEADWWFSNQNYILQEFTRAKAEGRLGHGTAMRQMAERQTRRDESNADGAIK